VIFSLPKGLVADLEYYAGLVRGGNKSGFAANALHAFISRLRKMRHTRQLRESYAAAAGESLAVAREWDPLSDEVWAKLEKAEG
jgi:hypothetical protein